MVEIRKGEGFDYLAVFNFLVWGHMRVSLLFGQPGEGFRSAQSFTPVQGI